MELLFVWINESSHGFFRHQGFNFSPEFNFVVKKKEETWVLHEDDSWVSRKSVFKDEVIENVSAIVGRNGAGKTTLLDYLAGLDCSVPQKTSYDKDYEAMEERDIKEALCIYIFREEDKICVYHNFENGFENKTNYSVKNMSNGALYKETLLKQTDFKDIFRIYITNSSCGSIQKDGISRQFKLDDIALTPKGISTIASSYYDKLLDLNRFSHRVTLYYEWRKALKSWMKLERFQTICDIVYFNKLLKEGRLENYSVHVSTKLSISCAFAVPILGKIFPQKLENRYAKLSRLRDFTNNLRHKLEENENHVIKNLVSNLVFEVCLDSESCFPENVSCIKECLEWVKDNLNATSNKEYFEEALIEIVQLSELLRETTMKDNVVPPTDLAYDPSLIFDYEKNSKKYISFLAFVEERFAAKYSFVLRYIMIENIGMSSGERAFQNYFSWINLLPQFHNIDSSVPEEMRSTIMLLIDEVDLYLHPEWQKNFISLLLDEVKNQFSDYKVQIIFATHSPLCLSDIPSENTIYLSRNEGVVAVDDRRIHAQTFGKDIYSLLNDAFYLENSTMGLFAQKYINSIIQQIVDKDNGNDYKKLALEEIELLQEKIQCIGNEVLKKKLLSMLQNCYADKNDELEMLYKQKNMIMQRISELEA